MDAACIDPSPYDVVLVHSQSRFFRDTTGYLVYKRKIEKHGVALVSIIQDFGTGASAEFAETVIAATVRQIFKLFLESDGTKGPMGIKDVASWLNWHGFSNKRGNAFFTSCVHRILTRETYAGVLYYNQCDSRARKTNG